MDERVAQVLRLAAGGYSVAETALMLGLRADEARRLLAEAIYATGACSKLEAIVVALRRGWI